MRGERRPRREKSWVASTVRSVASVCQACPCAARVSHGLRQDHARPSSAGPSRCARSAQHRPEVGSTRTVGGGQLSSQLCRHRGEDRDDIGQRGGHSGCLRPPGVRTSVVPRLGEPQPFVVTVAETTRAGEIVRREVVTAGGQPAIIAVSVAAVDRATRLFERSERLPHSVGDDLMYPVFRRSRRNPTANNSSTSRSPGREEVSNASMVGDSGCV